MSTLLEKQIRVNRIMTTSIGDAKAIDDPMRAKILEILYHKQMTAEQISSQLKKFGFKKALTTTRHHLEILKSSGLIEIVKIQEARGAILKFYGTSTKFLGYKIPEDFDLKYSTLIKNTSNRMEKLLQNISKNTKQSKLSASLKHVEKDNYRQYVLFEIVNRAMTNLLERNKK